MNNKNDYQIKPATIARLGALLIAMINQCLAIFGKDLLPFTENMAYQVISLAVTVVIVVINAWYNNDITKIAILSGHVFDALSDRKITEEEIEEMLAAVDNPEKIEEAKKNNPLISVVNGIIKSIKDKMSASKKQ